MTVSWGLGSVFKVEVILQINTIFVAVGVRVRVRVRLRVNPSDRHHLCKGSSLCRVSHLDKDIQFQFYINSVRKKKRFSPFIRASKLKDIDVVKEYYGYSNDKAKDALKILSKDQIKYIKEKLFKGGTK